MEVIKELALKTTITIDEQKYPFLIWNVDNGEITAIKFADKIYTINGTAKKIFEKEMEKEFDIPTQKPFVRAPPNTSAFKTFLENIKYNDFSIADFRKEFPALKKNEVDIIIAYQIKKGTIQQMSNSTFRVLRKVSK